MLLALNVVRLPRRGRRSAGSATTCSTRQMLALGRELLARHGRRGSLGDAGHRVLPARRRRPPRVQHGRALAGGPAGRARGRLGAHGADVSRGRRVREPAQRALRLVRAASAGMTVGRLRRDLRGHRGGARRRLARPGLARPAHPGDGAGSASSSSSGSSSNLSGGNIDNAAHVGGALAGAAIAALWRRGYRYSRARDRRRSSRRASASLVACIAIVAMRDRTDRFASIDLQERVEFTGDAVSDGRCGDAHEGLPAVERLGRGQGGTACELAAPGGRRGVRPPPSRAPSARGPVLRRPAEIPLPFARLRRVKLAVSHGSRASPPRAVRLRVDRLRRARRRAARPFALPSSTRHFERDRPFAIDHLALDIALDVAAHAHPRQARRSTSGASIPRPSELALDAVGFDDRERDRRRRSPRRSRYDGRSLRVPIDAGAQHGARRRGVPRDAAARPLLPRARRALPRPPAPGVDAVPGRGRAPLDPLPRQPAREDDDRDRRARARTAGTRSRTARSSSSDKPTRGRLDASTGR